MAIKCWRTRFASLSNESVHLMSNGERIALTTRNANNICVYIVPKVPVVNVRPISFLYCVCYGQNDRSHRC